MWMRIALVLFGLTPICWAGGQLDRIKDDLKAAPQVLRAFPQGEKLKYDERGGLLHAHPGIWTVDGLVLVESWDLKDKELRIRAWRMAAIYDPKSQKPVFRKYKDEVELRVPYVDDVQVESALRKIFILQPEKLSPNVPVAWRKVLEKEIEPGTTATKSTEPREDPLKRKCQPPENGVYKMCESITAPIPQYRPEPEYNPFAKKYSVQGTVTLTGVVDEKGHMRDLQIDKALGAGLDEQALDAVSKWKFKPSRKDGTPVPVQIMIDIEFHLY